MPLLWSTVLLLLNGLLWLSGHLVRLVVYGPPEINYPSLVNGSHVPKLNGHRVAKWSACGQVVLLRSIFLLCTMAKWSLFSLVLIICYLFYFVCRICSHDVCRQIMTTHSLKYVLPVRHFGSTSFPLTWSSFHQTNVSDFGTSWLLLYLRVWNVFLCYLRRLLFCCFAM